MNKVEQIKNAIEKAKRRESNLGFPATEVPMLGSLQIRHLMNNLGSICERFIEVGSHRGGSFVSATYGNTNIKYATAIDDYSENFHDGDAKADFIENSKKYTYPETIVKQISKDCFKVDLKKDLDGPYDFYLFDGNHSFESQEKAITYFAKAMTNEFILVVDDYSWDAVKKGTQSGIKIAELEIIFEEELWDGIEGNNEGWWNGTYVALLKQTK